MTSNLSFSDSVFYPLVELSAISSNLSSANCFSFEESKTYCFGKGYTTGQENIHYTLYT